MSRCVRRAFPFVLFIWLGADIIIDHFSYQLVSVLLPVFGLCQQGSVVVVSSQSLAYSSPLLPLSLSPPCFPFFPLEPVGQECGDLSRRVTLEEIRSLDGMELEEGEGNRQGLQGGGYQAMAQVRLGCSWGFC
jgi:hypothetical protein